MTCPSRQVIVFETPRTVWPSRAARFALSMRRPEGRGQGQLFLSLQVSLAAGACNCGKLKAAR